MRVFLVKNRADVYRIVLMTLRFASDRDGLVFFAHPVRVARFA